MLRDVIFVLMVLSVGMYAHSYKSSIISFIEVEAETQEEADPSLVENAEVESFS